MILSPIEDSQKYIDLCLEIQTKYPWLKYGYNLYLNHMNKIQIIVSKQEKVLYGPFYHKGVSVKGAGKV